MGFRAWVMGGVAASLFFAVGARAECANDMDCKNDRVCENHECREPVARSAEPEKPYEPEKPAEPEKKPEPRTRVRSRAALGAGIAVAGVSPIAFIVGMAVAFEVNRDCNTKYEFDDKAGRASCDDASSDHVTYVLIGTAALIAVGVPLIVVGAQRVPDESAHAQAVLVPYAGPERAGLALRLKF